ncbi:hypothetical protein BDV41DRAFT_552325 [Aspergillus transmontanensis]|uniref:Uncharacterized protein n=1 Tax=Aspergillus transmontanensis TaxID=1034304 RepID=A0A5N6VIC8_9EURO|nr:hypothetical protein BDV41DRAFT_552325 [Aspergillus transmontanensis]
MSFSFLSFPYSFTLNCPFLFIIFILQTEWSSSTSFFWVSISDNPVIFCIISSSSFRVPDIFSVFCAVMNITQ